MNSEPPTNLPVVLIADDERTTITILNKILGTRYNVRIARTGREMLLAANEAPTPDLIMLDVGLPDIDGYQLLTNLKSSDLTRSIPVIFVTARNRPEDEECGFKLGAADYITKPFKATTTLARVSVHVQLKRAHDALRLQNLHLEREVVRRMRENLSVQDLTIRSLARLAELRDTETGHHILRTQRYVAILADHLKSHPRFSATMTDSYIDALVRCAPLHDIGKVGIPDRILLKPGALTEEEMRSMRTHTILGAAAIEKTMQESEEQGIQPPPFMAVAREIARSHHERWDGSGYPDGLSGDAIPIGARLMALADTFDALLSKRVYKEAIPIERATAMISAERGRHFDPDVVGAFLAQHSAFIAVAHRYAEHHGKS